MPSRRLIARFLRRLAGDPLAAFRRAAATRGD
jgi:hypothetical protein